MATKSLPETAGRVLTPAQHRREAMEFVTESVFRNPECDNWPSVEDRDEQVFCVYCEAMPDERHHPRCPLSDGIDADDIQFCDECGCSFVTACACSGEEE
jgi:hypothetical protein